MLSNTFCRFIERVLIANAVVTQSCRRRLLLKSYINSMYSKQGVLVCKVGNGLSTLRFCASSYYLSNIFLRR